MKTYAEVLKEADIDGIVNLEHGNFLYSKETIIEEQKEWDEHDGSKYFDFTVAPFWLISEVIAKPFQVNNAQDLFDILDNNI